MMKLGADVVLAGYGIFESKYPPRMAFAIVDAVNNSLSKIEPWKGLT